jgi:hypothetical protein
MIICGAVFDRDVLASTKPASFKPWPNAATRCVAREGGSKVKLPRRAFLHLAAAVAALPTVTRMVWAQTYPSRPVGRRAT